MANNKDINADLGTQTIEGTRPPTAVEAEIVMPDGSSRPVPTAEDLDAQLAALIGDDAPATDATQAEQPVFAMPSSSSDDLDAQLAALIDNEQPTEPQPTQAEIDAEISAKIDAEIDAILNGTTAKPADAESDSQPIILGDAPEQPTPEPTATPEQQQTAPETQPEQTEQPIVTEQQQSELAPEQQAEPAQNSAEDEKRSSEADEARAMLEQAMKLMAQAQEAQAQANEQMQQAQQQAQEIQQQAAQVQAAAAQQQQGVPIMPSVPQQPTAADPASQSMFQQAQMMLQQAQQAQLQAQQAAQQAQLQAQLQAQQANTHGVASPVISDPFASREVDRLKNELDGMRDLVNKLTMTISQIPGGPQQMAQMAQMPMFYAQQQQQSRRDGEDREQYRKIETELEKMRREIMEKDLRDREKELDRRQKEAENTVKDIRPEMVQMSDSRDLAPMGGMNNSATQVGNEYIPLANGVYYSIKDKQVYVMTPASNAAAASPTIEPKRPAAPARPAPKRRVAPRRRPSGSLHRRPAPRRPGRPRR